MPKKGKNLGRTNAALLTGLAFVFCAGLLLSALAVPPQSRKSGGSASASSGSLVLMPASAAIDGSYGYQTLSAVFNSADGSSLEVTTQASFQSSNPSVVRIQNGIAIPAGDGQADITASYGGRSARARISVKNARSDADLCFANDITPILIKSGCIGSACHGAANGQGGLKLSFFGYEPDKDREAFWTKDKGRRVNPKDPASSMFVLKPSGVIPHGGGRRFAKDGPEFRTFVAWVRAGGPLNPKEGTKSAEGEKGRTGVGELKTPGVKLASTTAGQPATPTTQPSNPPALESVSVWPVERTVKSAGSSHQMIVTAHYSDGSARDVTPIARYFSDDDGIAAVNSTGRVTASRDGEANVMVRYNGKATVSHFLMLTRPRPASNPKVPENNYVDKLVFAKLKKMGIIPSALSTDAEFCRRVYLDIAGALPEANAGRNFVADKDAKKREKLIDDLLQRPEYQDVMTIEWSDLLRINRTFLQEAGVKQYTAFVRDCFAENMPFDQFVRELLGSAAYPRDAVDKSRDSDDRTKMAVYRESSGYHSGPVNYYRVTADPVELTTSTSQIFLGVRLDCCRCHNHPFDRWSMNDFYGFAGFFAGTGYTGGKVRDEVAIFTNKDATINNPRTGRVCYPKPLTAAEGTQDKEGVRHKILAAWITSPDNPFFARATVNRFWKHFLGRGIVHPVDDFRATNPPINGPLLDALAKDFVDHKFDVKHLIRTICSSRTYQLAGGTNPTNDRDTKNFSHYYSKRLGPEVLFDAITTATAVGETFGMGANARRATNLPDNNVGSYFLDVFGRSRRLQVQERSDMTSMSQALHLMNGGTINDRITNPNGRVAQVLKKQYRTEDAIEEIYLAALSRWPTEREKKAGLLYIEQSPTSKEGYEDLMWALINSREFIFNH